MSIKSKSPRRLRMFLLCLALVVTVSCGSRDSYNGTYKADAKDLPNHAETIIELKANGAGFWKVGDEEVRFSWYIKNGELRVNTKEGGVIVGEIDKEFIHIALPGAGTLSFKKIH